MASKKYQELKEIEAIREAETLERLESTIVPKKPIGDKSVQNTQTLLQGSGYLSQPNVKGFFNELATHTFGGEALKQKGRGTWFESVDELDECIRGYLELVNKYSMTPTISSLCVYLRCNRDTLYAHASNASSPFSESCKAIINMCHAVLEGGASDGKINSVAYIFQGKNYFGMRDTQDVSINVGVNSDVGVNSLNALKEQKEIEMKEANYVEIDK